MSALQLYGDDGDYDDYYSDDEDELESKVRSAAVVETMRAHPDKQVVIMPNGKVAIYDGPKETTETYVIDRRPDRDLPLFLNYHKPLMPPVRGGKVKYGYDERQWERKNRYYNQHNNYAEIYGKPPSTPAFTSHNEQVRLLHPMLAYLNKEIGNYDWFRIFYL